MPSKEQYKNEINDLIGRKKREDYSREALERYDRLNAIMHGDTDPKWRDNVYRQAAVHNNQIRQAQNEMQQALALFNLEEYKVQKKAELQKSIEELEKKRNEYPETIRKNTGKLSKEQLDNLVADYMSVRPTVEAINDMIKTLDSYQEPRKENHYHSYGGKYQISNDGTDTKEYINARKSFDSHKKYLNELDEYVKMNHELGGAYHNMDRSKVEQAVGKYNEAKTVFESRNSVQQFLGRWLPGWLYTPAKEYDRMMAYKDALTDAGINPDEEINIPQDVEKLEDLQPVNGLAGNFENHPENEHNLQQEQVLGNNGPEQQEEIGKDYLP